MPPKPRLPPRRAAIEDRQVERRRHDASGQSPPDLIQQPDAWERYWQQFVDEPVRNKKAKVIKLFGTIEELARWHGMTEDRIHGVIGHRKTVAEQQRELRDQVLREVSLDELERVWKDAGPITRRHHYFAAMESLLGPGRPGSDGVRMDMPEVSLRNFEWNDGDGYLNILRVFLGDIAPGHFLYIAHPDFERLYEIIVPLDTSTSYIPKTMKARLQLEKAVQRMGDMTIIVFNTILSFYGCIREVKMEKFRQVSHPKPTPEQEAILRSMLGSAALEKVKREIAQEETKYERCSYCRKLSLNERGSAQKFKVCKGCHAIGRAVRYCSRDCQTKDWKNGEPPHKFICGKPISEFPEDHSSKPDAAHSGRELEHGSSDPRLALERDGMTDVPQTGDGSG